jgi:ribosome recycling factor
MADEFELDTDDLQRRMDGAMASLRTEFASLRTGGPRPRCWSRCMVDAYGR